MNDPKPRTIQKGTYRHTKSEKLYEVVGIALHTESHEQMVIYRPLYSSRYELFARPYTMFIEQVELGGVMRPRFERMGE